MLVSCVAYQDGRKLAEIAAAEIHQYTERPNCFVWVALHDPQGTELEEMQKEFGLHPLAVEDARHGHRPKIEEYGDSVFAKLQVVEAVDGELRTGEVALFAGPNYVLSVRREAERGFQDVRARCEREPELLRQGSGYVLYALMDSVVDRYFPLLEQLEGELAGIEEHIFTPATSARANLEALFALKRRLTVIRRAVAPLLEGISNLSGARVPAICADLREYFRDVWNHLQWLNQTAEWIRDSLASVIALHLSMVAQQENETMKRLAAYAALLAVPSMIAGIYGMNFEYIPELKWRYGYEFALLLMVAIDVVLFYRLRKAKWL